ncbi:immunoglobulin i-set domain-containing protein [Ditylenchus destructor]|uniref:Immunoglobulin i-set domain-containing protein n=1 Tax=Ditylenchus destructor TaxID=166010 RepID=A0AAD4NHQ7_9BILA|nr:immunoglobulin i-set domain-containing protein [Ditylenchus destructor]
MVLGPFFDKAPSIINRPDGSVLFECMCNANPEPKVQWFHKDKELSGDRYIMKHKKQVGKYICTLIMKVRYFLEKTYVFHFLNFGVTNAV